MYKRFRELEEKAAWPIDLNVVGGINSSMLTKAKEPVSIDAKNDDHLICERLSQPAKA